MKNITCNITYNNTTSLFKTVKVGNLYTGLCQVCHTKTKFFSNYTAPQHYTSGCLDCHKHKSDKTVYAFQPSGGCDGCHGYPPVQTMQAGYGHMDNYSGARLQNYSGGGGAHDVAGHVLASAKATQVWTNCLKCHYGSDTSGNHMRGDYTKPSTVNVQVDPKYKFDSKLPITYSGNKSDDRSLYQSGTCSNVSCHFQASPKWSSEK
ncbi:CxxxxCH/CxxCH domain-containing protein [Geotalea toluenoxydans]|uniref:CxxxxCH/CxxCH domain-containing protein n=1 Tax=Geotalea toluenoxydans TaxID=421624 RepID=UPI0006D288CB|nr:CxxxxCH/CxxCH domain-containing protein [Geotalea toluenoxydans]